MIDHEEIQAALSARLDGEPAGLSDDVIDAHLAHCPECRAFQDRAAALSRTLMFAESQSSGMAPPDDLSEVILAGVESQWRRNRFTGLAITRILLVILGIVHVVWALALVGDTAGLAQINPDGQTLDPTAQPEALHLLIEAAGFRFALAMGLFWAAWRPQVINGLIIIPATMTAFIFGFTVRDVVLGTVEFQQIVTVVMLITTVVVLALGWLFDRGLYLRQVWKALGSNPN